MNYNDKVMDVIDEVKKVVIGKDVCIAKIMAAIIAGGNILMDDVPGVGKTTMALAFANAMGLQNKRVQFTPDVLPGDITGFTMYDKATNQFVYRPGAVMCNLFLADEIILIGHAAQLHREDLYLFVGCNSYVVCDLRGVTLDAYLNYFCCQVELLVCVAIHGECSFLGCVCPVIYEGAIREFAEILVLIDRSVNAVSAGSYIYLVRSTGSVKMI